MLLVTYIHLQGNSKKFKNITTKLVLRYVCALDKQYKTKCCQMVMVIQKLIVMAGFLHLEMCKC